MSTNETSTTTCTWNTAAGSRATARRETTTFFQRLASSLRGLYRPRFPDITMWVPGEARSESERERKSEGESENAGEAHTRVLINGKIVWIPRRGTRHDP